MANGGLFLTPQQALAAEAQMRQQGALSQGFTPVGASAQELGRSLAGAFGKAIGAPPQESPDVQLARTRQQAIQGLDPQNPSSFMEAARSLYSAGDIQGAATLIDQGRALAPAAPVEYGDFEEVVPGKGIYGQRVISGPDAGKLVNVTKSGPGVNIDLRTQKELDAKVNIAEKDYNRVIEIGDAATSQLPALDQAKALVSDESFQTGRLEPLKAEISAYAESFGVDPAALGLQEASTPQQFAAITKNLVLGKLPQLKGPTSDKDVNFVVGSTANLADQKEAVRMNLDFAKSVALMEQQKSDFYRNQFNAPDVSLTEINDKWRNSPYNVSVVGKGPDGKPIFWNQYYSNALSANQNNPDYYDKSGNFMQDKLLNDIQRGWKKYGVR